jgi:hypothetical protein
MKVQQSQSHKPNESSRHKNCQKAPTYNELFFLGPTAIEGLGLLIVEVSSLHSDTPHSAGMLWTNDRPIIETSLYWQHTKPSQARDIHASDGIQTRNPRNRETAEPNLRRRG